jgi:BlaI family penicillinase repressor
MSPPKLSKLELKVMEALWGFGASSIREVHERLPVRGRPAYTTVQTLIGRLETKKAVGKVRKIGGANIYDALISREKAQSRLIDDFLALFGGRAQLIMSHFVDEGKLTLEDVQRIERNLRKAAKDKKP